MLGLWCWVVVLAASATQGQLSEVEYLGDPYAGVEVPTTVVELTTSEDSPLTTDDVPVVTPTSGGLSVVFFFFPSLTRAGASHGD